METINPKAQHLIQKCSRPDRCNLALCEETVVCKGNWDPLCKETVVAKKGQGGLFFPFQVMKFGSDSMGYYPCPFFQILSPSEQNKVRNRLEIIE
ncbi:hypothetical protein GF362_02805 [Candidatus Dojkabacteria bacterium]|nr:hypothetical protein [Candidatus Dojkabacteria bacterium]